MLVASRALRVGSWIFGTWQLGVGSWILRVVMKNVAIVFGLSITAVFVILGGATTAGADMPVARGLMPEAQDQTPAAPAFEVASIKPSSPNPNSPLGMIPMVLPAANGPHHVRSWGSSSSRNVARSKCS